MLYQSATPDTSSYMIAGYTVFVVIMVIYLASLFFRRRNLDQDLSTLQTIAADTKPTPGRSAAAGQSASRARAAKPAPNRAKRKARKASRKK